MLLSRLSPRMGNDRIGRAYLCRVAHCAETIEAAHRGVSSVPGCVALVGFPFLSLRAVPLGSFSADF
jgi:hypothetical protein